MKQVVIEAFGGPEVLQVRDVATPEPGPGQVRIALKSIGMNHADLMARAGQYKLSSGDPPFTPGLEGGGTIEAVGEGVDSGRVGQRVTLSPGAPRGKGRLEGTYRSHYVAPGSEAMPVPEGVPDEQLGALWLTYLTAWGCLIWKQRIKAGDLVALPAASSGVALAAAQLAREAGATPIGLTTHADKAAALKAMETNAYEHVLVTHDDSGQMVPWQQAMRDVTGGHGVDVFFDPVATGAYLQTEIKSLAQGGVIWVYGLLGRVGEVDVTPLMRKRGAIRGWMLYETIDSDGEPWRQGAEHILAGFADGRFTQPIAQRFKLADVQQAHREMEKGAHIGKLIIEP